MAAFTSSRPTKPYRSIACVLLALIALIPPSESASNDSYSYLDARFVYTPKDQWHLNDTSTGIAYTNYTGAKVTTHFFGSAVYLSSSKKANQYQLQVIIDDVDKYLVNLNGPNTENAPQEVLWGVQLVEGNHTFQAINLRADPDRPYVAFASLTVTTGQVTNSAPAVSSQSFHSVAETEDDHAERNSIMRRATGAAGALAGFIALVFIAYRAQRRRHRKQLQQGLHTHRLAAQKSNLANPEPAMVAPTQNLHYVAIRPQSSTYTVPTTHMDRADSLLIISEGRNSPESPHERDDESEFWRPRKNSDSSK
ncbi:hypothetical protein, variant [Puccinia triticina 1-1 BBBD Race 1]|uniref:Uncharacterized protein n=2 Tax=Puccinia triticina TaxID=208348 RepID=A0A0C4EXJ3_PUCT1|nr:uncharacterized protein PtA15_9A461 [Puccinia triticina]OAV98428.1 hypothetical protein PTTG_05541 [Puccinia triticina 1-1 BBBD Race 1]OAV98429.1 hypothetical protein, variant [Puccinia triticina 1-1 BBBD Race 1]WAQ88334.1 hypothetical protein PtA15_9A461 [Puccinia triticina]WAR60514.1 hypothetical protein PtB15_9B453 [Puccinia triticina]